MTNALNQKYNLIAGLPVTTDEQIAILAELETWAATEIAQKAGITATSSAKIDANDIARMLVYSQHLQGLARRHSDLIPAIISGDGDTIITAAIAEFHRSIEAIDNNGDPAAIDSEVMAAIRRLRQRSALCVAIGDLANVVTVTDQMRWLSNAAEAAIDGTARHLLSRSSQRGLMPAQPTDMTGCGWTILALGKLGAGELNYSSDVDLIILHDPENTPLFAPQDSQNFYVGLTRQLVKLLSQPTADGIGWRVDLRLRPDPGATAVSIQRDAALGYYESIARTWERAAFIRARPIGGDREFGAAFLADIQPFVWRRTLDYTVMDDMKSMLRRPQRGDGWFGFDLKTGANGIRRIEFLTHILQLVAGGRSPSIRLGSTLPALVALAGENWIDDDQAEALGQCYLGLRRLEHRLQMLGDAQTHSLPRGDAEMTSLARFLGWPTPDAFLSQLGQHLAKIGTLTTHTIFADHFGDQPNSTDDQADDDDWPMLEDEEQLANWLSGHGFDRPHDICATISGWMSGRIAATRSERARILLSRLAPQMLAQIAKAADPHEAFAALAQFIEGLPASVQIFSLLDHNRHLTRLLCDILILSPRMADYLRYFPALFDLVMFDEFFAPLPKSSILLDELRDSIKDMPIELALQTIQRRVREWRFRIETQALSEVIDDTALGEGLSAIADAVITITLELARADMERRHGFMAGHIAIIGLGRLGLAELTAQSDLDLIVVYDGPDDADALSDGTRAIGPTRYFTRLTQTFINWMGMADVAGPFYLVDMRLRPDGEKGNIAVHLDRLGKYYEDEAWVWERLAFAKSRIVAVNGKSAPDSGDHDWPELADQIIAINQTSTEISNVASAITEMRERLRSTYGTAPPLALRKQPGGLSEIDLLVQGLRIANSQHFAATASPVSANAIITTLQEVGVISPGDASDLLQAAALFSRLHHYSRLCVGRVGRRQEDLSPAIWHFLLGQMDMPDAAYLQGELDLARANVSRIFDSVFATT